MSALRFPFARGDASGAAGTSGGSFSGFDYIVSAIAENGYVVLDEALPPALTEKLFVYFTSLDRDSFREAGIGRDEDYRLNQFQRRDRIYWLRSDTAELQGYFAWVEQLRQCINRRLFLGLFDYECHYACYPEGGFYKKHVDAFRGRSNRRLSTILYLNPQWRPDDGGELALYREGDEQAFLQVLPEFGRMVIFLSEDFPHEVLKARRSRFSLTGWYRVNGTTNDVLDPPVMMIEG